MVRIWIRITLFMAFVLAMILIDFGSTSLANQLPKIAKPRQLENNKRLDSSVIIWESLAFSPDGLALAADGEIPDNRGVKHIGMTRESREYMQVWDLSVFRSYDLTMLSDNRARRMVPRFSADGKVLYASARENMIRDWLDQEKGRNSNGMDGARISSQLLLWPLPGKSPDTVGLRADPDGVFIASHLVNPQLMQLVQASKGIQDYQIRLVPSRRPNSPPQLNLVAIGAPRPISSPISQPALFSADGSVLVAKAAQGPPGIIVWDVPGHKEKARLVLPRPPAPKKKGPLPKKGTALPAGYPKIELLTTSQKGDIVSFCVEIPQGRGILIYNTSTAKIIDRFQVQAPIVTALSLNATGDRLLYIAGGEATVRSIPDGKELRLPADGAKFKAGAISPDGRKVAAGGLDGVVRLWTQPDDTLTKNPPPSGNTEAKPIAAAKLPDSQAITPEQLELYHLLSVRRLFGIVQDLSQQNGSKTALLDIARQAEARQRYLRTLNRPIANAIAELYGQVARSVEPLQRAAQAIRTAQAEMNRLAIQSAKEKASENSNRMFNAYLGLMVAMAGSLEGRELVGTEQRGNTTVYLYETYELFPGWAEAGISHVVSTMVESTVRRNQMAAVQAVKEANTRGQLVEALEQRNKTVDAIAASWETIATTKLGLPKLTTEQQPNLAKLFAAMEKNADEITKINGREDPLTRADLLVFKCVGNGKKPPSASSLHKLAEDLLALYPVIPVDKVHDGDRARLLGMAATAKVKAIITEAGRRPVTQAKNSQAEVAISWLNLALSLQPNDPTGLLSEQKSLALAALGQTSQALELARQRATSKEPDAVLLLARLECAMGAIDPGLDHLEEAIKLGYRDLIQVRSLPDFPASHRRFLDLTTISVTAEGNSTTRTVRIRNTSWFPLKNVRFQVNYLNTFNRKVPQRMTAGLGDLAPGETFMLMVDHPAAKTKRIIDGKEQTIWIGSLIVSAPGFGIVEVPITDR